MMDEESLSPIIGRLDSEQNHCEPLLGGASLESQLVKLHGLNAYKYLQIWQLILHRDFDIRLDLATCTVAEKKREGFEWIIPEDLPISNEEVLKRCSSKFIVLKWTWLTLDDLLARNEPHFNGSGIHFIRARNSCEADVEHRNKSANDLLVQSVRCMTLKGRLLLELFYHELTDGKHLDRESATLCAGSRGVEGDVPYVCWGNLIRELQIGWNYSDYCFDSLGAREVIV